MTFNHRAIHVLGMYRRKPFVDEGFAKQRSVSVTQRELPVGLSICFAGHVRGTRSHHFPEHVTLDECTSFKPSSERMRDARLARSLSANDEHRAGMVCIPTAFHPDRALSAQYPVHGRDMRPHALGPK